MHGMVYRAFMFNITITCVPLSICNMKASNQLYCNVLIYGGNSPTAATAPPLVCRLGTKRAHGHCTDDLHWQQLKLIKLHFKPFKSLQMATMEKI